MSRGLRLLIAAATLAIFRIAPCDILHLQGGGTIDADRWWIEGDTLHVESVNGSMGLPRTMLVRVEPKDSTPHPAAKPDALLDKAPAIRTGKRVSKALYDKMNEANAALSARDFDRASILFYEIVDAEPDAPGPRVGYALAEMALGRDAIALPVALDGLTRTPDSADLHEVLGSLRDREERVEDALTEWREAFRLAPSDRLRDKIMKAERELAAARNYEYSAAAHFTLRYDGALDQDLVAKITDVLEDSYEALASIYRHAPSQPITVLLYPQQTFHDVTQAGHEVAGLYDGKIRVPLGGLKALNTAAEHVLKHELTHAIISSKTRGNCPRWLHEGLAQVAEPRAIRRSDTASLARTVRPNDPATWPESAFSYPAALSFTRFLESQRGFDALVSVLAHLGDGDSIDQALQSCLGQNYAELAAAWAETLQGERTE